MQDHILNELQAYSLRAAEISDQIKSTARDANVKVKRVELVSKKTVEKTGGKNAAHGATFDYKSGCVMV
jgi:hypothetical protein